MWKPPEEEWYFEEHVRHERQLHRLPDRLPYVPPTAEEKRKAEEEIQKLINEIKKHHER